MKLNKKIAALAMVVMMATAMPVFGESVNGVNKIVTVAQDAEVEAALAPEVKIELKDELKQGDRFYLNLQDAKWASDIVAQLGTSPKWEFTRVNHTQLEVEAKVDIPASTVAHRIPLITTVTGEMAKVAVDANGTVLTSGQYTFALTANNKSTMTVEDPTAFALDGEMAKLTIEEQYIAGFKSSQPQILRINLDTRGMEFDYSVGHVLTGALKGKRSYVGLNYHVEVIDATTLEVEIPANSLNKTQRGSFELSGIRLKATNKANFGPVEVSLRGDLGYKDGLVIAHYSDYGTELKVAKDYDVVAGQQLKDIEFTLSETVPNSLTGTRETFFTFPEGITIDQVVMSKKEGLAVGATPLVAINKKDGKNTNFFTLNDIGTDPTKKVALTFKATLNVPADFSKDINLVVEGPSIDKKKEVLIARLEAPVSITIAPASLKVGLAKQVGGTITLTETDKENMAEGKIFFALEESGIKYTKAPEVKVTKGDIILDGDVRIVKGGLELTVRRKSINASTIEMSGGEISVDRMIADGEYRVEVGGPALSVYSSATLWDAINDKHNDIAPVAKGDFMIVGPAEVSQTAVFVIGQSKYTVNGEEKTMDTAAYLAKEGRTMLPVRYSADALGINSSQILWDSASKTVTVMADENRIIQIKLGSKEMVINRAVVPMTAAAEMKNNRIFIPVAEIARALDATVLWDSGSQTVTFR